MFVYDRTCLNCASSTYERVIHLLAMKSRAPMKVNQLFVLIYENQEKPNYT